MKHDASKAPCSLCPAPGTAPVSRLLSPLSPVQAGAAPKITSRHPRGWHVQEHPVGAEPPPPAAPSAPATGGMGGTGEGRGDRDPARSMQLPFSACSLRSFRDDWLGSKSKPANSPRAGDAWTQACRFTFASDFASDVLGIPLSAFGSKLFLQGLHYFLIVGIYLLHFSC